jgi:hypothetical protein
MTAQPKRRGPNTEAGRAAVRLNALKHGITSNSPVIPGMEDETAWRRHRDGIVASLAPEGHLEEVLAERIASLLWRLQRVTRYEIVVTMRHIERAALDVAIADNYAAGTLSQGDLIEPEPESIEEAQEARILPPDADLDRIFRHETHFHRQWVQTLHELEALQARRRGQPAHLARLDISSPPP